MEGIIHKSSKSILLSSTKNYNFVGYNQGIFMDKFRGTKYNSMWDGSNDAANHFACAAGRVYPTTTDHQPRNKTLNSEKFYRFS